jgi:uncharacterized protein (DUF1684 family)
LIGAQRTDVGEVNSMQRCYATVLVIFLMGLLVSCGGSDPSHSAAGGEAAPTEEIPFLQPDEAHLTAVEAFRSGRETRLRSEGGWLALVGLHWFDQGASIFGSATDGDIVFPAGSAPAVAGTFYMDGDSVSLESVSGVEITLNKEPVTGRTTLVDDSAGSPDTLKLGRLTFSVIRRGDRSALRVKDPESPTLVNFNGLDYFPANGTFRVSAGFKRYEQVKELTISSVVGPSSQLEIHGELEFSIDGATYSLLPFGDPAKEEEFFIIFKDLTNGSSTYGAGRYLRASTSGADGGQVVLDFNLAYNPPCIFTPYATCPLPPSANYLATSIAAGEKSYTQH